MISSPIRRDQLLEPVLTGDLSVKLIGLGGVGGIVARYGAMYLASLRCNTRLVLIDGDSFESSNSTRMFFGACGNKAAVTLEDLLTRFAESRLTLVAIEEYVTTENLARLLHNGDMAILCVDNHATRKLVNDHCCERLQNICLISGGNDGAGRDAGGAFRRGTYGNVQILVRRNGKDATPALSRFHPEIARPEDRHPADQSCTDLVASVPQILFTNLMTASCILNALWLYLCESLHYGELAFDIADGLMRPTWAAEPAGLFANNLH